MGLYMDRTVLMTTLQISAKKNAEKIVVNVSIHEYAIHITEDTIKLKIQHMPMELRRDFAARSRLTQSLVLHAPLLKNANQ